jgi:hypothetical protein
MRILIVGLVLVASQATGQSLAEKYATAQDSLFLAKVEAAIVAAGQNYFQQFSRSGKVKKGVQKEWVLTAQSFVNKPKYWLRRTALNLAIQAFNAKTQDITLINAVKDLIPIFTAGVDE